MLTLFFYLRKYIKQFSGDLKAPFQIFFFLLGAVVKQFRIFKSYRNAFFRAFYKRAVFISLRTGHNCCKSGAGIKTMIIGLGKTNDRLFVIRILYAVNRVRAFRKEADAKA